MNNQNKGALHQGHRQRLKQRYINGGISNFQDHEILELLLFFAIPYKDTNALAHELMNQFGSLSAVLSANPEYLKSFKNMTNNASLLLKLVDDITKHYYINDRFKSMAVNTSEKLKKFLYERYESIEKETVFLLLIEKKNRVVDCIKLHEGRESVSEVKIGDIAKIANIRNISRVILVHNHPDDSAVSTNDVVATKKISYHLNGVDIELCESYVLTRGKSIGIIEMTKEIEKKNKNNQK